MKNEWGKGTHRTRWKLTEEDARKTFGERLVRALPGTAEERQVLDPGEAPAGLHR